MSRRYSPCRCGIIDGVPTTPEQVVAALRDALGIKATVALEKINGAPHAVVAGPSGVQTWVDLRTSISAYPDEDAPHVAAALMAFEGWDALHLDDSPQRALHQARVL